jgi:hypothetical protein
MSTAYLSTANQQDAKGEVRDVCVQVAISQTPTGRPRFEPLLRHLGQVSIRRRALEGIEEARDDTAIHQARAESGVGVVQASDDRDQGDAETGAGESDKGEWLEWRRYQSLRRASRSSRHTTPLRFDSRMAALSTSADVLVTQIDALG